jgi:hypothetical protein
VAPGANGSTRRGGAGMGQDAFVQKLVSTRRVVLEESVEVQPSSRRGAAEDPISIEVDGESASLRVVMARYPSGAVSFHAPDLTMERRGARAQAGGVTLRFTVPPPTLTASGPRRSLVAKGVKLFVLKIVGKVADVAFPKLVALAERRMWRDRPRGLLEVTPSTLEHNALRPLRDHSRITGAPKRNLLLLHGTISSTSGCFKGLATTQGSDGRTVFDALADAYEGRLFGFDHFTISETPEENARALLRALPEQGGLFDVVTHSRGALVLRTLVELRGQFGAEGERFKLNSAVVVAGPNAGTPLASPARWGSLTSWLANLMEILPDNPFTFGVGFVAEALNWLARQVGERIPGLASMNPDGEAIRQLQQESPETGGLTVLTTNYEPTDVVWRRMLDLGVDMFFGSANDLVVPSEGAWRIDPEGGTAISGDRIGCFGRGGNIVGAPNQAVHHCNFFVQSQTVDFITRTLAGKPLILPPMDPQADLPYRKRGRRGSIADAPAAQSPVSPQKPGGPSSAPVPKSSADGATGPEPAPLSDVPGGPRRTYAGDEVLSLFIMDQPGENGREASAVIIASFRNARVVEPFPIRGGEPGKRWQRIIAANEGMRAYIDGAPKAPPIPTGQKLIVYGCDLFETIFPGQVRRLYDAARAELRGQRLDVVLTSTIGWVADKPWEFAYDPTRQMFLALEEVNFIRNILTAVPADAAKDGAGALRILIVAAQPVGAAPLSEAEEIAVLQRGFRPLIDAGLAKVEILVNATPALLHEYLESSHDNERPYDILHFIGHGEFDREAQTGYLLFEDARGGIERLNADVFRQIVARRGIRLVFLNACETGTGTRGRLDFGDGVAPFLVAGGVPAVVANQFKVLDPSATAFAQHFYWALAQGRCLGDAAREARVSVNYSITGEAIDWAVPVVFARNPRDRLVTGGPTTAAGPAQVMSRRASGRRSGERRAVQVALWDVNHALPRLEQIAADLTRAQTTFGFDVVDVSAPVGTWRLSKNESYLDADDIYEKLSHTPTRLGVNWLVCLTTFKLKSGTARDLIVDVDEEQRIGIISVADILRDLSAPETTLERLVGNLLAFTLCDLPYHKAGPKDCPSYYNEERDLRWSAGRLKFCRKCSLHLPRDLKESVTAMVAAFP